MLPRPRDFNIRCDRITLYKIEMRGSYGYN